MTLWHQPNGGRVCVSSGADDVGVALPPLRGEGEIDRIKAAKRRNHSRVVEEAVGHIGQAQ